jgi:hypothetical protein
MLRQPLGFGRLLTIWQKSKRNESSRASGTRPRSVEYERAVWGRAHPVERRSSLIMNRAKLASPGGV